MGKATRWLKGLLGMKKEKDHCGGDYSGSLGPEKKRSGKDKMSHITPTSDVKAFDCACSRSYVADKVDEKNNKPAIDVAFARLRSHARGTNLSYETRERMAAVKIQSFFRGYLARKAHRALKGLVKLQALVRGYLVRKRVAATLHSVQAMIRAQDVARSQRARRSMNKENRFHTEIHSKKYLQLFETRNEFHRKRLPLYCKTSLNRFNESPKGVEIETHMPHSRSRSINTTMSECGENLQYQAVSSCLPCGVPGRISVHECRYPNELEWYFNADESNNKYSTAHNTPRFANCMLPKASMKSVCRDNFIGQCSNFPNYMANTHSSKAKRSHSAPKQRPEMRNRFSLNEMMAARNSISGVRMHSSSNYDRLI
ncbi:hypothetical protein RJT34_28228 [Clitoria ternatea]|uniref:DUF4005 domain-containing protein n=1 Tax=Clitoria ternatea TaxID=43366 RepID=A0AAN9IA57_CLITE